MSDSLIRAMEQTLETTDLPLDRRLLETGIWFYKSRERIPDENVMARLAFSEKTLEIVLEMFAMTLERLRQAEGRKSNVLYTPRGLNIRF